MPSNSYSLLSFRFRVPPVTKHRQEQYLVVSCMSIFIFLFVFAKLKKKRNAQKRLEGRKSHVPQELTTAYLRLAESSREGCKSMPAGYCNCATTGGSRRFKPIDVSPGTPPLEHTTHIPPARCHMHVCKNTTVQHDLERDDTGPRPCDVTSHERNHMSRRTGAT